jgi:hypothetical protein
MDALVVQCPLPTPHGKECEDCGDYVPRRVLCYHCGLYVCRACWNHKHRCEPGHTPDKCASLALYRKFGRPFLMRVRARIAMHNDKLKGGKNRQKETHE